MFVAQALKRFREKPLSNSLPYALGRFATVRGIYGRAIGGLQSIGAVPGLSQSAQSIFDGITVDQVVENIRANSAYIGLRIPPELLREISEFSRSAPLRHWQNNRVFHLEDIENGRFKKDGAPAIIADVVGIESLAAARSVALDPLILGAITAYARYVPMKVDIRALVSFAGSDRDDVRREHGQTIDFHYDVHSYNFMYANFYLTDTDRDSGAHVMVTGSHKKKPPSWLWASANRSDQEIADAYEASRIVTIEGPAGTGFLQDSSCFHKALAPRQRDRMMLHLRYY